MTRLLHLFLALAATASVAVSVVTDFKVQQWLTSTTCDGTPDTETKGGSCQDMTPTMPNNVTASATYESLTECKKGGTMKIKVFTPSKTCAGTGTAQDVPMSNDVNINHHTEHAMPDWMITFLLPCNHLNSAYFSFAK